MLAPLENKPEHTAAVETSAYMAGADPYSGSTELELVPTGEVKFEVPGDASVDVPGELVTGALATEFGSHV